MNKQLYISSYCKIKNNTVITDNEIVFNDDNTVPFSDFSKNAYKSLNESYSKFFKMDNLCKLGYLNAEFLLKNNKIDSNTAIVLSNNASSLDTDISYQESIAKKDNYYPSPAVFVYTLPNIVVGEISIKHKLQSENAFFISEKFNAELLLNYAKILIANKKSNNVLCGWVNYDQGNYESILFLVSEQENNMLFTLQNLNDLYLK